MGAGTSIKYLVLQVHYHSTEHIAATGDDSGVILQVSLGTTQGVVLLPACLPQYTEQQLPRTAGVLLLGTGGSAPPHSTTYFETACEIEDERTIHPFAFRTHTHSLGELVFGLVRKHPRAIPVAYEAVYHVSSAPSQQGAGVTCITTLWIPGRAQFT